jgi:hypothetical protein
MYYQALKPKNCCREKATSITHSENLSVALFIQHAKWMPRFVLSLVTCLVVKYYSTFSHKRHDFRQTFMNINIVF